MRWDMYNMTQKIQVLVLCVGGPLVMLAASLWHDWVEEGKTPRTRKIMRDWEWNIDEMAHAINLKAHMIGYRILLCGVIMYIWCSYMMRGYRAVGLGAIAMAAIIAEALYITIKTIRNTADDEDKKQTWKTLFHNLFSDLVYMVFMYHVFFR